MSKDNNPYLVHYIDTGDIHQIPFDSIMGTDPVPDNATENTGDFLYHPWIDANAKVTLFLPQPMKKPQQG